MPRTAPPDGTVDRFQQELRMHCVEVAVQIVELRAGRTPTNVLSDLLIVADRLVSWVEKGA